MPNDPNPIAFGLIFAGALFSLGREILARAYVRLHGWLKKKETDLRLQKGVEIYLMLTGMIFTVLGLLGLFGVIHM